MSSYYGYSHMALACLVVCLLLSFVDPKAAKTATKAREVPDANAANEVDEPTTTPEVIVVAQGEDVLKECEPYAYCSGTRFSSSVSVRGKIVTCNQVPTPLDMCCLPVEKHLICYNIQVDGLFLSFDQNDPSRGTDFTEFCRLMVEAEGEALGSYTSVTRDVDSGQIAYRYNEWAAVSDAPGSEYDYHIRDLACGIQDDEEDS